MAIEIDEAEYATLSAAKKLLEQMNGDPTGRKHLTAGIKVLYPNTRTEEDIAAEVAAPYIGEVKATASRMEEMLAKLEARDAAAIERQTISEMDASFTRLKSDFGYNDEGIEKVKRLMVDRNIPDPEAAAALFERQNPKPSEAKSSWEPALWDFKENAVDVDVAGLFANPDKWEDQMIGRVLLEERSRNNG